MPDSSLSGGDVTLVVIVLAISLAALGLRRVPGQGRPGRRPGHDEDARDRAGGPGRRGGLPETAVPHPRRLRRDRVHPAPAPAGRTTAAGGPGSAGRSSSSSAPCSPRSSGFIGMTLATRGNVRVAQAARSRRLPPGLPHRVPHRWRLRDDHRRPRPLRCGAGVLLVYDETAPIVLEGFGFGGALLAMFMRVGGGIFTKAADVGADLVGKVEAGIPEDDPRNAATIADNVGDNVGDCAGMAADLFESYAVTLVAALILGQVFFGADGMVFPLLVAAIGVIASVVGILASNPGKNDSSGLAPINRGFFTSAAVSLVLVAAAVLHLPAEHRGGRRPVGEPAGPRLRLGAHRRRARRRHPAAHRLLHRDQPQAGQGRRPQLAHRPGHGHPLRHVAGPRVRRLRRASSSAARSTAPSSSAAAPRSTPSRSPAAVC